MTQKPWDELGMRSTRFARRVAGKASGVLEVEDRGLTLRYDTSSPVAWRWFTPLYAPGRIHEPGISAILHRTLGPESVFFDVGANLGYFTVLAAHLCRKGAVHAFEIDPGIAALIPRSLSLNPDVGAVRLNCVGVSGSSGDLVTFSPLQEDNASTNRIDVEAEPGRAFQACAVTLTLDDYCAKVGVQPDLIKMDIEGAEALAIDGMAGLLAGARPRVVLEVHPPQIRSFGSTPEAVIDRLLAAGYRLRVVPEYRDRGASEVEESLGELDRAQLAGDRPVMVFAEPGA